MSDTKKLIVTIGRCCGSGGKTIGKALAERLGISFYDRNLLNLASENSGISEELFVTADEKLKKTSLFKASRKSYNGEVIPPESADFTSSQNLFNYQTKVIRELAASENCIIIGRCSEDVLWDYPYVFRVFISGSYQKCAQTEAKEHGLSLKAAYEKVDRVNKYRADE